MPPFRLHVEDQKITMEGSNSTSCFMCQYKKIVACPISLAFKCKCVEALLAAGAALDVADEEGKTALMLACEADRRECVGALIAAGAALDAVDHSGRTAVEIAHEEGSHRCANALFMAMLLAAMSA